jgi:glycosyltransferase involved in cell wall biosynthesis
VTGLLVPVRDGAALALAVTELAASASRRQEMGVRGRRKAEAEFDDRTVIERTLAAYRSLPEPATSWTTARMAASATGAV